MQTGGGIGGGRGIGADSGGHGAACTGKARAANGEAAAGAPRAGAVGQVRQSVGLPAGNEKGSAGAPPCLVSAQECGVLRMDDNDEDEDGDLAGLDLDALEAQSDDDDFDGLDLAAIETAALDGGTHGGDQSSAEGGDVDVGRTAGRAGAHLSRRRNAGVFSSYVAPTGISSSNECIVIKDSDDDEQVMTVAGHSSHLNGHRLRLHSGHMW